MNPNRTNPLAISARLPPNWLAQIKKPTHKTGFGPTADWGVGAEEALVLLYYCICLLFVGLPHLLLGILHLSTLGCRGRPACLVWLWAYTTPDGVEFHFCLRCQVHWPSWRRIDLRASVCSFTWPPCMGRQATSYNTTRKKMQMELRLVNHILGWWTLKTGHSTYIYYRKKNPNYYPQLWPKSELPPKLFFWFSLPSKLYHLVQYIPLTHFIFFVSPCTSGILS